MSAVTASNEVSSPSRSDGPTDETPLVDDLHDLLVGLVGDPGLAASATVDTVLRTVARAQDGVHDRVDPGTLRRAAVAHAVALAEAGQLTRSPSEVLDLAVLDLVDRRGLDGRVTGRIAGVRHRSIPQRRARALHTIADGPHAPAVAGRDRATAPLRPAPRTVRDTVTRALADTPVSSPGRASTGRTIAAATLAVVALAAMAVGTPRLVGEATAPAAVVVGEPVEFTPVPSTGVVVEGGPEGTQVAGEPTDPASTGGEQGETAAAD